MVLEGGKTVGNLDKDGEVSMVTAICGVQLKDKKRANDLVMMVVLKGTIVLAMANSLCCIVTY